MSTRQLPYTSADWKIPGYTGYVEGLKETFKKTPILCQQECRVPEEGSFLLSRSTRRDAAKPNDPRDPAEAVRKTQPDILWPNLQEKAAQDLIPPPKSNVSLGDERIDAFRTSYSLDFRAPFEASKCIRSPMRNYDLAKAGDLLKNHYQGSYNRVGQERLMKMMTRMRERLEAKLGNSNDNAFKLRKLFKMYDTKKSGMIQLEDFRMMTESFGMQLDDDSLLALYHVYDPNATGFLKYEDLMRQLLDPDYFSLYVGKDYDA